MTDVEGFRTQLRAFLENELPQQLKDLPPIQTEYWGGRKTEQPHPNSKRYCEIMAARGLYRDAPPLPSILGYEVVGRVEACGAEVPAGLVGKRVVAMTRFGGYAQKAVTDHRACAEIPETMSLGEAAALATQDGKSSC